LPADALPSDVAARRIGTTAATGASAADVLVDDVADAPAVARAASLAEGLAAEGDEALCVDDEAAELGAVPVTLCRDGGAVVAAFERVADAALAVDVAGDDVEVGLRRISVAGCDAVPRAGAERDSVSSARARTEFVLDAAMPVIGPITAERVRSAGEKACGEPTMRRSGATRAAVAVAEAGGAANAVAVPATLGRPVSSTRRSDDGCGSWSVTACGPSAAVMFALTIEVKRVLGDVGRHVGTELAGVELVGTEPSRTDPVGTAVGGTGLADSVR
jgi:hypothetical protein